MFQRELAKLEKDIGGIQDMNALPDAMFVIDVGYHKIAVAEAKKLGIPIIGVVDSNHSPIGIDYVIPGNDDSSKAVALYAQRGGRCGARRQGQRRQRGRAGGGGRGRRVRRSQRSRGLIACRARPRRAITRGCFSPFFPTEIATDGPRLTARPPAEGVTRWPQSPQAWSARCAPRPTRR